MNYIFITGSSKGLGKSLVEKYLDDSNNFVFGFARTCSNESDRYKHFSVDFSDKSTYENFEFPQLENPEKIVLINNAGWVGDVKYVGSQSIKSIEDIFNVNVVSLIFLCNQFIAKYADLNLPTTILNISSGAANYPIDGWSNYCSTKAAVNMFSQVFQKELQIRDQHNIKVFAMAPGIIDTGMQQDIRSASKEHFSDIDRFLEYKNNGDLSSPEEVAEKIKIFISKSTDYNEVLVDVRNI